jgi:hypothetical protein
MKEGNPVPLKNFFREFAYTIIYIRRGSPSW